jgi:hypothetical protein
MTPDDLFARNRPRIAQHARDLKLQGQLHSHLILLVRADDPKWSVVAPAFMASMDGLQAIQESGHDPLIYGSLPKEIGAVLLQFGSLPANILPEHVPPGSALVLVLCGQKGKAFAIQPAEQNPVLS